MPVIARARLAAGLLLMCLAPPLRTAAQAEESTALTCQDPFWSRLPLATAEISSAEYDPTSRDYYSEWVLKNVMPAFVFSCISAALLAAFLLWRLARLATCVACLRGPRLRGKPASELLSARCMRWLRWGVATLAAGVIAGAGFGFSTIQPSLQPSGIDVYDQAKDYVSACVAQANATAAALDSIDGHVTFLRQRVLDLGLAQAAVGALETIDKYHRDVQSASRGMHGAISDVQSAVLDRMHSVQREWQPRLDKLDILKNAVLYGAYVLIIASSIGVALGVGLTCPGLVKTFLCLLLFMLLLAWATVSASTVGLQVGSNGCAVVEQKIADALLVAAQKQVVAGEGILSLVGVGDTLSLTRYYFYGQGKNATEVLADLTGLDIPRLVSGAQLTVQGLQQAALAAQAANTSVSTLPDDLAVLAGSISQLSANISELEAALSFDRFHPLYMAVKTYACCDVLDFVGGLWLGLLVVGCCGLPLTLAVFWWLGRLDKLAPKGCCHMYRPSDYAVQPGPAVPELPDKKQRRRASQLWEEDSSDSEDGRSPGHASRPGSLSLRQKFAAAGLLRGSPRGNGAGAGAAQGPAVANAAAAGAQPGGSADTFRIGAGAYTPGQYLERAQRAEVLPDSPPSAPTLPLTDRSLGSVRRLAGAQQPWGTWAAAAPPSARGLGSRSAPGSALNSARSASAVQLLPAVEALSPGAQAAFSARSYEPSVAGEDGGDAAAAESDAQHTDVSSSAAAGTAGAAGGGASALARAGNALKRLKLMRRS